MSLVATVNFWQLFQVRHDFAEYFEYFKNRKLEIYKGKLFIQFFQGPQKINQGS